MLNKNIRRKIYNVNIYVNYPEFIEGLCIYYGTSASALNLMSITNLHQKLNGSTSSTVIVANSTTSGIFLPSMISLRMIFTSLVDA